MVGKSEALPTLPSCCQARAVDDGPADFAVADAAAHRLLSPPLVRARRWLLPIALSTAQGWQRPGGCRRAEEKLR
jgi:hypothetical protein